MQSNGNEGNAYRAGLANANFATQLLHVEDLDSEQISVADYIIVRNRRSRGGGERTDAIVGLLRCFDGLRAAGRNVRRVARRALSGFALVPRRATDVRRVNGVHRRRSLPRRLPACRVPVPASPARAAVPAAHLDPRRAVRAALQRRPAAGRVRSRARENCPRESVPSAAPARPWLVSVPPSIP